MLLNKKVLAGVSLPSLASLGVFGGSSTPEDYKIMVNYNGQADLLLSLQIYPDYYPYQFKRMELYDYLTEINNYIVVNENVSENKKQIKAGLQGRLNELFGKVKEFGSSLWNADLYDTGIVFRNDQFWNNKRTSVLFLEQFIADDYTDIKDSYNLLPVHKDLIVTNYRAARDPYTIFSKTVFDCFLNAGDSSKCKDDNGSNGGSGSGTNKQKHQQLATKFKKYMDDYNLEDINSIYRFGKYIEFWNDLITKNKEQMTKLDFESWLKGERLFSVEESQDKLLAQKYMATIFNKDESEEIKKWDSDWKMNYQASNHKIADLKLTHHPALEQQILPGTAPLAEGSQKDIVIFLYQFAALIDKYTKTDNFKQEFKDDDRKTFMENALNNASSMAKNIKERIKNIRDYFKAIGVVDSSFCPENNNFTNTNSKTFTVVTYPPSSFGAGEATIQSMSKFPFIYWDIGLKQPVPSNLSEEIPHEHTEDGEESFENEIFSVDDNGWWWKIGNANLDPTNMLTFTGVSDTMLILANEDDWNLLNDKSSNTLKAVSVLAKNAEIQKGIDIKKVNTPGYPVSYNKYHLWNEGLRSPIALNLLLDNLVDIFQKQYDTSFGSSNKDKYQKAMDWGDYWHSHFLNKTSAPAPTNTSK